MGTCAGIDAAKRRQGILGKMGEVLQQIEDREKGDRLKYYFECELHTRKSAKKWLEDFEKWLESRGEHISSTEHNILLEWNETTGKEIRSRWSCNQCVQNSFCKLKAAIEWICEFKGRDHTFSHQELEEAVTRRCPMFLDVDNIKKTVGE